MPATPNDRPRPYVWTPWGRGATLQAMPDQPKDQWYSRDQLILEAAAIAGV